jgi:broad specificity phosphatase PhoE
MTGCRELRRFRAAPTTRGTTIYLVRHGETEMNRRGLLQGQGGFGLTEQGAEDARGAARALRGRGVQLVLSSDLRRARETAAIVREAVHAPVRISRALREIDFGRVSGLPEREVKRRCPLYRVDASFVFPGGESYAGLQRRIVRWFRRLAARPPARTLAVVSHGGTLRCLLAWLAGLPLDSCLGGSVPHGLVARVDVASWPRIRLLAPVTIFPPAAPDRPSGGNPGKGKSGATFSRRRL